MPLHEFFSKKCNLVNGAAGSGSAAAVGNGHVVVDAVVEELDDMVTVEDDNAGEEEIEMIMVDESVDVPISVPGEDPSVPVMVVDESIPVDTVVEADGKFL